MKEKRLIKYSDFSETFKVWEGSDIDVESELKQELAQLGSISAAEELNNLAPLNPLIAMNIPSRMDCCDILRWNRRMRVN